MNEIISVIIPVYKVEKYLDRCLQSVVNQTYKNLEIILIDDGSPDNCPAMCDEWAKKDNRIKVIHKANGGLGMARNTGLENATGDYFTFLDSDDYMELNSYELALNRILEMDADMCYYGGFYETLNRETKNTYRFTKDLYQGDEIETLFLADTIAPRTNQQGSADIGISAGKVLCKLSLVKDNNLKFLSEREVLSEDLIFRIEQCKYVKKVATLHKAFYHYCYNGESLTKSYNPERFNATTRLYDTLIKVCSTGFKNTDIIIERCNRLFLCSTVVAIKFDVDASKKLGFFKLWKNIKTMVSNKDLEEVLNNYPLNDLPFRTKAMYWAMKHKLVGTIIILSKLKLMKEKKQ